MSRLSKVAAGLLSVGVVLSAACHDGPTRVRTGGLDLSVAGLPVGTSAAVTVTGPQQFSKLITSTGPLQGLVPGAYSVTAASVHAAGAVYAGTPATQSVTVVSGNDHTPATVSYALASGSIALLVSGVPAGDSASVTVTGPGAFVRHVSGGDTLRELAPGTYVITADTITAGVDRYAATTTPATLVLEPSTTPVAAQVAYAPATGALSLGVVVPPGSPANLLSIVGPDGFRGNVGAVTLRGLVPGTYAVTPRDLQVDSALYRATPATQSLAVQAGATASATFTFARVGPVPGAYDLSIDGVNLVQVTQSYGGYVPLVRGRDALLRVFVTGNKPAKLSPQVRVSIFESGVLTKTFDVGAAADSVPQVRRPDDPTGSWNVRIPGALIQPGLGIQAEVDPDHRVDDATRADNRYPAAAPQLYDVRDGFRPAITLVPVVQSVNGAAGGVSMSNVSSFLDLMRQIYPVSGIDADVRAPYTTTAPVLQPGDGNGAWSQILEELAALRAADGSNRRYYGVVHAAYTYGLAGLSYVGGPVAMGWDWLPSGSIVMAHEIGHTYGRMHAPCGGATGVDPNFPYPDGSIGTPGYDATNDILLDVHGTYDLMSYCLPAWMSDYTYNAILGAMQQEAAAATAQAAEEDCLLVWGRIVNGQPVLEPAFEVHTRPLLPKAVGPYTVHGVDPSGGEIFSLAFAGDEVADARGGATRIFAFAVPLSAAHRARLSELRLSAGARMTRSDAVAPITANATNVTGERLTRAAGGRLSLHWNAASYPMVMVRDARTGEILSFARGGTAAGVRASGPVDVVFSDGVHSVVRRNLNP